jgi:hypothetical protein
MQLLRRSFVLVVALPLLLFALALTQARAAGATVVFDTTYLPDSAGCSGPVLTAGGDTSSCDQNWIMDNRAGGLDGDVPRAVDLR